MTFPTGKVDKDQVEDYAKCINVEEAERWLAPVLSHVAGIRP